MHTVDCKRTEGGLELTVRYQPVTEAEHALLAAMAEQRTIPVVAAVEMIEGQLRISAFLPYRAARKPKAAPKPAATDDEILGAESPEASVATK